VTTPDRPGRTRRGRAPGIEYADTVATHRGDTTGLTRRWTFLVPSAYAAGGIARTVFTTANTLAEPWGARPPRRNSTSTRESS
jgi:hypothetical protein